MDFREQRTWRNPRVALEQWTRKLEALGVLVIHFYGVEPEDRTSGFSLYYDTLPVIGINASDRLSRQVFTLFHELVHLLLRNEGLCDLAEGSSKVEVFCNYAAGATLVPEAELLKFPSVADADARAEFPDSLIESLARDFGVSREALVRRLLITRKTSEEFYLRKRAEYQAEEKLRRQQEEKKREEQRRKKAGGPQPHIMSIKKHGTLMCRLVIDALHGNLISRNEASDWLGVKLRWIPRIEERVAS